MNALEKIQAFLMQKIIGTPEQEKIFNSFFIKQLENMTPEEMQNYQNNLMLAKQGKTQETVQVRVPQDLNGATSVSLTFDYTSAVVADGEVRILIGDVADLMKLQNPSLQKINSKLKIDGYYKAKSVEALNEFAKSAMVRLKRMQTQANQPTFFTTKQPLQMLNGMYGQSPRGVNYNFQKNISPADQNLVARLDEDFTFDLSSVSALQFILKPGDLVTYTWDLYQVGLGQMMELV